MTTLEARIESLEQTVSALSAMLADLQAKTPRAKNRAVTWDDLIDAGMSGDVATDFIAHRRQLKAPLTPTAWSGIQREVTKANMDLDSAATLMMARGWRGFMANWVKPEDRALTTHGADQAFLSRLRHSRGE